MAHAPFISIIGKAFYFIIASLVRMRVLPWVLPSTRDFVPHLRRVMVTAATYLDVPRDQLRWKVRLNDVSGFF
eukprot:SAG22_NODE_1303_length_4797_cov_2976.784376_3_plen_73_part_00